MASILAPDHYNNVRATKNGGAKDHARENFLALKEAQRLQRLRAAEAAESKAPLYKMKQFENVASRVNSRPAARPAPECGDVDRSFLRRGAREEQPTAAAVHAQQLRLRAKNMNGPSSAAPASPRATTPRKGAVPARTAVVPLKPRQDVSFVARNRTAAVEARAAAPAQKSAAKHDDYGRNPAYLDKRKEESRRAAELQRLGAPDPDAPAGMVKMADSERLEMLQQLRQRTKDVELEHFRLPLNIQTQAHRRKQADLEAQLAKLEKSIAMFDRPTVYIQA